jgi:hypothetical protein
VSPTDVTLTAIWPFKLESKSAAGSKRPSLALRDLTKESYFYLDSTPIDSHWRDLVLFYEYFHDDNGAGLEVGHQTGWTGIVARTMHPYATTTPEQVRELGKTATVTEARKALARETAKAAKSGKN